MTVFHRNNGGQAAVSPELLPVWMMMNNDVAFEIEAKNRHEFLGAQSYFFSQ